MHTDGILDSLRIIQDSPADWEHESQLMGEVYKRAICNLSVSAFNTGIQGFFAERTGNPSNILALQVDTKDGQFNASAACPEEAQFYLLDESVLHGQPWREICSGSLFERAWVLQEQILVSQRSAAGLSKVCRRFDTLHRPYVFFISVKRGCSGNAKKILRTRHGQQAGPIYPESFMVMTILSMRLCA